MGKAIEGAALMAGAIGLEVATSGAATPLASQMFLAGVGMEAGAIAHALGSSGGIGITTRQAAAPRQIIYGEYRVGAVNVYRSTTGSKHDQFNFVDVLAGHPIDSIVNMYLDGRQVYWHGSGVGYVTRNGVGFGGIADGSDHVGPGGQHYNFGGTGHSGIYAEARFGDQTATSAGPNFPAGTASVIGGLTANDPGWAASGTEAPTLMGCAYLYFKCEYNPTLFPSEPERRYTVRGKNNIYDPRTGTYGWTNNWGLIVADVLTDPIFGLGDVGKVNQAQLIAAANICDEMVSLANGNQEKRYTLNWAFDTSLAPGDVLNQMMLAAGGRLSYVGGEWFIYPAAWQGVSFDFDSTQLTGPVQWKPYRSLNARCNRVQGTYMAPNVPYNDAGNLYDSNGWFNGTILNNFPFSWHPTSYPTYAQDPLHGYPADLFLEADSDVQGAWDGTVTYAAGDVITYSSVIYKSLVDGNVANQPDTHSWAGGGPAGVWASGTTYAQGDGAVYSGQLYVSLAASNVGNQPDTSPTDWAAAMWIPYQNLLPMQLDLPMVLSNTQAQRVAKIALLRNRQEGRGTLPLHLACWKMQPLDVMTFSFPDRGWSGKQLEVLTTRFGPQPDPNDEKAQCVRFEVDVQETAETDYEWSTSEELTPYDVPANPSTLPWTLGGPTGVAFASDASTALLGEDGVNRARILVTWTDPADVRAAQIEIDYQPLAQANYTSGSTFAAGNIVLYGGVTYVSLISNNTGNQPDISPTAWQRVTWASMMVPVGVQQAYVSDVVGGTQYVFQLRAWSASGDTSAWAQYGPIDALAPNSQMNTYTLDPPLVLSQINAVQIGVAATDVTFGNRVVHYSAQTITIGTFSVPGWVYVAYYDPTQNGDAASPPIVAHADSVTTLAGQQGFTYMGAIYMLPAGGGTRVTPGGWPAPYSSQVGV